MRNLLYLRKIFSEVFKKTDDALLFLLTQHIMIR